MSIRNFLISLPIGLGAGAVTLMVLENPVLPFGAQIFIVFLAPGYIVGMLAGSGVDPNKWVAVLGNFFFYSGLTYLALVAWEKHTQKASDRKD